MSESALQVQKLYERRPYPHYPLLAKPRWQDGYLGSSLFAHSLLNHEVFDPTVPRQFLSIGSGEILPYVIRQWEPSATRLDCVDLSKRSLRRAQFRTALLGRRVAFHCEDINSILVSGELHNRKFTHIEAYGVLHHIPNFASTLQLIENHLADDGIVRIMVYNSQSRDWLWQINRAYRSLGLNFYSDQDIENARQLLMSLSKLSPRLESKLKQIGQSSLSNNTRFADTFLHPWESRASIREWFKLFAASALRPVALYDRYAELDDLPNPLWQCPGAFELDERARDLRFENNLELWLAKNRLTPHQRPKTGSTQTNSRIPVRLRLTMPALNFSKFSETSDLTFGAKLTLWQGFLRGLYNIQDKSQTELVRSMQPETAKRLARVGLILPKAAKDAGRFEELLHPLCDKMNPPILPEASNDLILPRVRALCAKLQPDAKKVDLAVYRLMRTL